MTRGLVSLAALLSLGACVTEGGGISIFTPKPDSAEKALELYYDTIPNSALPSAGAGAAMPSADSVLTTILIGSCLDEEKGPSAAMMSIANEQADLFLDRNKEPHLIGHPAQVHIDAALVSVS